jgi:hypothetical protein
MSSSSSVAGDAGFELSARIPADVDAPDRVAFDLTVRQLAVLAVCGTLALGVWAVLTPWTPLGVRAAVLVPFAGVGLALAAGRRDGLPLDGWLLAAAGFRHRPTRLTATGVEPLPDWLQHAVPTAPTAPGRGHPDRSGRGGPDREPAVLRLPTDAIDPDGTLRAGQRKGRAGQGDGVRATVLVAATTVNITLRTPGEQAGLVAGLGRWLNGLTTPVQIVVSTRRVDLAGHATRLAARASTLGGALAAAAADHAEFLLDLAEDRDPLARTVTIAATATGGPAPEVAARRAAEYTVSCLTALGADATVLDGATATAVLAAASDPYQATDPGWPRTPPGAVVTARRLHVPWAGTRRAGGRASTAAAAGDPIDHHPLDNDPFDDDPLHDDPFDDDVEEES